MTIDRYTIFALLMGILLTVGAGWALYIKGFLCRHVVPEFPPVLDIAMQAYDHWGLYQYGHGVRPALLTWDELTEAEKNKWIVQVSQVLASITYLTKIN